MAWNWQHRDWPVFRWQAPRLAKAEQRFLMVAGTVAGAAGHAPQEDQDQLAIEAMCTEAVTTSEIEGEVLDRASVQSSIQQMLGLSPKPRRVRPGEQGIAEMMVDLHRRFEGPLDHQTLFAWHEMVVRGRRDLRDVGRYRTHAEPMRVISGRAEKPNVHFEAPPSARVPAEMDRFVDWFNETRPGGTRALPAVTRAGAAHLYFESIHPFEDGNGRVGRAVAERALAQSLGRPSLTKLAATILSRRREYYDSLESANKRNEITDWLAWFAGISLEAQQRTLASVEFLIEKTRLLDRVRDQLNLRQEKALLRVLREGPDGFEGGLSAGKYAAITKASTATATRDLADMVDKGMLRRTGRLRHARYHLPIQPRPVPRIRVSGTGEIIEGDTPA